MASFATAGGGIPLEEDDQEFRSAGVKILGIFIYSIRPLLSCSWRMGTAYCTIGGESCILSRRKYSFCPALDVWLGSLFKLLMVGHVYTFITISLTPPTWPPFIAGQVLLPALNI